MEVIRAILASGSLACISARYEAADKTDNTSIVIDLQLLHVHILVFLFVPSF